MQRHKLPSTSTQPHTRNDQKRSSDVQEPVAMQPSISPALITREEPSSLSAFTAALNLPDLSSRKELAFRKNVPSQSSKTTGNEASPSGRYPPTRSSSSARHSQSSLSAQLNGPLAALDGVTASLRSRGKKEVDQDEPLWKGSIRRLTVGRCASTSSSALTAYPDRLEYKFHSSSGSSIAMIMYVRDMAPFSVTLNKTTLSFHISTPLVQFSSTDYSHTDPSDLLSLSFFTIQDMRDFKRCVETFLPLS